MWQYTSTGKVDGIMGDVDVNELFGEETVKGDGLPNLTGYIGDSIVKGLHDRGYPCTFSYRTELWDKLGKTEKYKGTAEQNLTMIKLLGGKVGGGLPCVAGYKGFSIVQALNSFGYKSDFEYRKTLWGMIGEKSTYKGTATQNMKLLNELKKG